MVRFEFKDSRIINNSCELTAGCEDQLRLVLDEITRSAVAAGWSEEEVLASLMKLSREMYQTTSDEI